ncbi:MAG: outer membrane lipoprotein-sorting protein [Alphaproteobacteria bacterium]|nr:MAG: outer membrane lipoprotein-sorting protein [Alphaproteobacteria bacterium]
MLNILALSAVVGLTAMSSPEATSDTAVSEITQTCDVSALEGLSAEDLLRKVDELYRSDTSEADIRMQIITPDWERTMSMMVWSEGMEKTFIRILSPKKDRGIATLKLEDEMWNYFPKINKTIKVPPSMMMSSWMGSDFTNDDLVKEATLADDYTSTRQDTGCTSLLTLVPMEETVTVWAKIEVLVDLGKLLPLEERFYNERGEKVRTMTFSELKEFSGNMLPSRLEMVPHNKEGHKTVIYYDDLRLNVELDEDTFTWAKLKERFN